MAEAVRAHLAAVEDRLRRAEVDRARAEARADGERRRRLAWGIAATALVGLAGTTAVATWAGVERGREETARAAAAANERKAIEKKEISLAVQSLLGDDLLQQADATAQANALLRAGGGFPFQENPNVKDLLDRAARRLEPGAIDERFPDMLAVQAAILNVVGKTYWAVGSPPGPSPS